MGAGSVFVSFPQPEKIMAMVATVNRRRRFIRTGFEQRSVKFSGWRGDFLFTPGINSYENVPFN